MQPLIRHRYSTIKPEDKPRWSSNLPSKTKQSFKDECDINQIMKKFEKTGILPDLIKTNPVYGDFSDPKTYQESLNLVHHAQEQFSNLSSKVRERFNNDPQKFLEFTSNAENADEMAKMGLLKEESVKRVTESRETAKTAKMASKSKKPEDKNEDPQ